jgi:hypothetical protein
MIRKPQLVKIDPNDGNPNNDRHKDIQTLLIIILEGDKRKWEKKKNS